MRFYLNRGLGGIVCNVAFQDYMRSEQHWKTLIAGVRQCQELGMVVWVYGEQGYPSGAAGGLVLEEHRQFEAMELAYDATRDDPFIVRPACEYTHASNNYYASRRYANSIDHEHLAKATVESGGTLAIGQQRFATLIVPQESGLPRQAQAVGNEFRHLGGRVVVDQPGAHASLVERWEPDFRISPPSDTIALGRFRRDGHRILLVVNMGRHDYGGHLTGRTAGSWRVMDPATGDVRPCEKDAADRIPLVLAGRQAALLVQTVLEASE